LETKAIFVGFTVPPSIDDIAEIADAILDELPPALRKHTARVKVQVEDFPDDFTAQEEELETMFDIEGRYLRGPGAAATRSDVLFLYRRPILDTWAETGEDLARIVNRVIIEVIGMQFGFSEDEIELYEEDMLAATAAGIGAG
jgi:predicted Zn-dependent protease with MMP-like domain